MEEEDEGGVVLRSSGGGANVLVFVMVLFMAAGCWTVLLVLRNRGDTRPVVRDMGRAGAGLRMRVWVHVLLLVAISGRVVAVLVELLLKISDVQTLADRKCEQLNCWVVGVLHGVPDIMYLSMYSLLTLYFAQLYYETQGISYASLRPGFVVANFLVFLIFASLALVSLLRGNYFMLRGNMFAIMGLAYLFSAATMFYYGVLVIFQLRTKGNLLPNQHSVQMRVVILCFVCILSLLAHAGYCIAALTILKDTLGYPKEIGVLGFDALAYTFFELVPTLTILVLTTTNKDQNPHRFFHSGHEPGGNTPRSNTIFSLSPHANQQLRVHSGLQRGDATGASAETSRAGRFPQPVVSPTGKRESNESLTEQLLRNDHELQRNLSLDANSA